MIARILLGVVAVAVAAAVFVLFDTRYDDCDYDR